MTELYPASPKDFLTSAYLGKDIRDVPTPAAIIDVAAVKRNCSRMLSACDELDLGWRAHVKTHKTVELTRLQVGEGPRPVRIIVSTVAEAEFLQSLLEGYASEGRSVNVLYGLPLGPSQVPRLAAVAKALGNGSMSFLVDHSAQLDSMQTFVKLAGVVPLVHIKVDMGGRRAGVIRGSAGFASVVEAALKHDRAGHIKLSGVYSHAGHSYGGDTQIAAMTMLQDELKALQAAANDIQAASDYPELPLTLSVGASPTALSVQNLVNRTAVASAETVSAANALYTLIKTIRTSNNFIEIHAGVYPTLDLQQLAAHSLSKSRLSWSDIAFTVLAEVLSLYPGRGASATPEALIGAGGLALGREFCKAYPGMAMLTPWNRKAEIPDCDVEEFKGWIVGRFAQEHGILTWSGEEEADEFEVGQKVRLWPNHACITGSHFGWYFVVDSSRPGQGDEIVDIWTKARGW